eukprot:3776911-Pleurochrysis_carterae.AAC.3
MTLHFSYPYQLVDSGHSRAAVDFGSKTPRTRRSRLRPPRFARGGPRACNGEDDDPGPRVECVHRSVRGEPLPVKDEEQRAVDYDAPRAQRGRLRRRRLRRRGRHRRSKPDALHREGERAGERRQDAQHVVVAARSRHLRLGEPEAQQQQPHGDPLRRRQRLAQHELPDRACARRRRACDSSRRGRALARRSSAQTRQRAATRAVTAAARMAPEYARLRRRFGHCRGGSQKNR